MYYLQKNTYSIDVYATGVQVHVMKTCLIVFKEYIGMNLKTQRFQLVEHSLLNKYYRRCPPWDFDSQQSIVFTDIVVCSMCIKSMYAVRIFITLVSSESTLCCIRQQWFCKLNIFREVLNYRYAIWGVLWFITWLKWYEVCKLLLNYQGLNKLSVTFFNFSF